MKSNIRLLMIFIGSCFLYLTSEYSNIGFGYIGGFGICYSIIGFLVNINVVKLNEGIR